MFDSATTPSPGGSKEVEVARCVARWWRDSLVSIRKNQNVEASLRREQGFGEYPQDTLARFENVLSHKIFSEIRTSGECVLDTRCGPCRLLTDSAVEAGLGVFSFGWPVLTVIRVRRSRNVPDLGCVCIDIHSPEEDARYRKLSFGV